VVTTSFNHILDRMKLPNPTSFFLTICLLTVCVTLNAMPERRLISLDIQGLDEDGNPTSNLLSFPLFNEPEFECRVEMIDGNKLTLQTTPLMAARYRPGLFFAEIVYGPGAGLFSDIWLVEDPTAAEMEADPEAAFPTITVAEDWSTYLVPGDVVAVRRHHTWFDVFGERNRLNVTSGADAAEADEFILFYSDQQASVRIFYSTLVDAWVTSHNPTQPITDFVMRPGQGFIWRAKHTGGNKTLRFTGCVKTETAVPVQPGLNLVGNTAVSPMGFLSDTTQLLAASPSLREGSADAELILGGETRTGGTLIRTGGLRADGLTPARLGTAIDRLGQSRLTFLDNPGRAWWAKLGISRSESINIVQDTVFVVDQTEGVGESERRVRLPGGDVLEMHARSRTERPFQAPLGNDLLRPSLQPGQ